jgi:formylglycine-generating enzyme required for sulfatase activity
VDLDDCNVGFKHWHPTPIIQNGDKLAGHAELGGVWEWTSSPIAEHDGFKAMEIYPGYTCMFPPLPLLPLCHFAISERLRWLTGHVLTVYRIADFFDGKHNIILGGSWATHPRIAGRTTL